MNAEVDKLDINKLINLSPGLNKRKTKFDNLDVGKLKTVPADLKKLSDAGRKEFAKNKKFNKINIKVRNLEKKIPVASTLLQTNQYNADKKKFGKKLEMLRMSYLKLVV